MTHSAEAAAQDQVALALLQPYADVIAGAADGQEIEFVPSTWRRWLDLAGWPAGRIDDLLEPLDGKVTRGVLRDMARTAGDAQSRQCLLAATLIWGRGKANGRMRDHMIGALRHPDLDQVLEETSTLAVAGRAADAYRAWHLPGLREPFFTKWLWAASTPGDDQHLCLVLDLRVWNTLNYALDWTGWIAAGNRSRPARYDAYVQRCHLWASDMGAGVSAEDVEWALFYSNGDLANLADAD